MRSVNRSGRGYSFDVLRAKILYSAGLHKYRQPARPKLRVDDRGMRRMAEQPVISEQAELLGSDLSTLVEWFQTQMF